MQEELMQYRYAVAAKKFKMVAKTDASCQSTFKDPGINRLHESVNFPYYAIIFLELDAANAENLRLQEKLDNQFKQYDSHIWSMDAGTYYIIKLRTKYFVTKYFSCNTYFFRTAEAEQSEIEP